MLLEGKMATLKRQQAAREDSEMMAAELQSDNVREPSNVGVASEANETDMVAL